MELREHFAGDGNSGRAKSTSRTAFFPFTCGFLVRFALDQQVDNRGRPVQGISGCKGNRANVSRPPGAHEHASRSF